MKLGQSTLLGGEYSELVSSYRMHGNHVPFVQKFSLFSVEFCLSFRTLLYQFSDFISHTKFVIQQWDISILLYPCQQDEVSAVAVSQQIFFIQFLDLWSNPIFGSSHG